MGGRDAEARADGEDGHYERQQDAEEVEADTQPALYSAKEVVSAKVMNQNATIDLVGDGKPIRSVKYELVV